MGVATSTDSQHTRMTHCVLRVVLGIGFMCLFAVLLQRFLESHWEELAELYLSEPIYLVVVGFALTAGLMARARFLQILTACFGTPVGRRSAVVITCATNLVAVLVLPAFAVAVRAAHLHRHYGLRLPLFAGGMATFGLVWLSASALVGLVASLYLHACNVPQAVPVLAGFTALSVGAILPLMVSPSSSLARRLPRLLEEFMQFRKTPNHLHHLAHASLETVLACMLTQFVAVYAAFRVIGNDVGIGNSCLLSASQQVGGVIGLTPGAVGFQELLTAYLATTSGIGVAETVTVLLILRGTSLTVAILAGLPCVLLLICRGHSVLSN